MRVPRTEIFSVTNRVEDRINARLAEEAPAAEPSTHDAMRDRIVAEETGGRWEWLPVDQLGRPPQVVLTQYLGELN